MAKTIKYSIEISSYSTDFVTIPISKAEYTRLVKHYRSEVAINNAEYDEENEYYVSLTESTTHNDKNHFTEYSIDIRDNGTYISLTKLSCDEGYHFK